MAATDDDTSSNEFLEEDGLQINEIDTSSESEYKDTSPSDPVLEINMLTKEEEFLLSTVDKITDPEAKQGITPFMVSEPGGKYRSSA